LSSCARAGTASESTAYVAIFPIEMSGARCTVLLEEGWVTRLLKTRLTIVSVTAVLRVTGTIDYETIVSQVGYSAYF
jgi:hypothetical protein